MSRRRQPSILRLIKLVFYLSFLLFTFLSLWKHFLIRDREKTTFISPLPSKDFRISATVPPKVRGFNTILLSSMIEVELADAKGIYGIAVKNLKSGEYYGYNGDRKFEQGSLYKLWIMAAAIQKIEAGDLDVDKLLSSSIENLNLEHKIATEDAELTEGGISLTVDQAIYQMITISNNYAAYLLYAPVGLKNVTAMLKSNNLNDSKIGNPPISTPNEIALFLEKLYRGELANPENTQKMLAILKDQQRNTKLPPLLPEGTEIAHKTGEIGRFSHDAGIVFTPNGDYVIVVMSDSGIPAAANERISKISKAVYEYFQTGD